MSKWDFSLFQKCRYLNSDAVVKGKHTFSTTRLLLFLFPFMEQVFQEFSACHVFAFILFRFVEDIFWWYRYLFSRRRYCDISLYFVISSWEMLIINKEEKEIYFWNSIVIISYSVFLIVFLLNIIHEMLKRHYEGSYINNKLKRKLKRKT